MTTEAPELNATYGAFEIGVSVATFLYGIGTLQTYNYYRPFPNDSSFLRTAVAVLWFLELGQSICAAQLYSGTVTSYGRQPFQEIAAPPRSLMLEILFSSLSCTVGQLFFSDRIRRLSGHWLLMLVFCVLIMSHLVGDLFLMVQLWTSPSVVTALESKLRLENIVLAAMGPFVDILLAIFLCLHLRRLRGDGSVQFRW
ncbi:hypothetical protein B0H16DRAFT_1737519 [Mycena metata]|uniref:Uncharacterized protein n=1 Tax=Mycena metata TaxID=1033252 RepID=A0AAD7HL18_9AGAR|nr:hypothetical protein B0H16DRAFT_1737519 [Mycena metata]